ncbi:MAG: membrane protein insertase YidC [Desulfobacula sp.]|uniref:membrane protein insertase YidC n=1 Tax=Desulfobacula sp. TaxID=2593537 RepID=UPI001D82E016|nr:membrane protein insertase YidC [Desulfobacula sp.]MBT3485628.1 membrane protein insertase YidC [Desulfobacula sp.]MBT3805537.1 membrane protein insertase YidC [Desulfobacula sp.]MBT4024800.1 membrane protein insertase YidC [Desulfobacula sp.]MBT4200094.1 membrane protein insertase YidC [Desulfobacula sp.]
MDEQKRLLLAVVLSVVVLVGYQTFFVKPPVPNNLPQEVQNQNADQQQVQKKSQNVSEYKAESSVLPQKTELQNKNYRTISVSTPLYDIAISEYGAAVRSFELKDFKATNKKDSPLKQLVPEQLVSGTLFFDLKDKSIPGLKDAIYKANIDTSETSVVKGEKTIEFILGTSRGIVVKKIFTFKADSYMIDCDIVFQNGSDMPLKDSLVISTPGFFDEETKKRSRFAFEGPVVFINEEYTAIDPDDIEEKSTYDGEIGWSGYSERYFMTAVMPGKNNAGGEIDAAIKLSFKNDIITTDYIQKMDRLDPGQQGGYSFIFYMGPKSLKILGSYDNSLKNAINLGFFNVIAKPLLITMNMIYSVIPNYGVAIILLTILIKLIFWPLGTKSYKSMNEMKKVQPLMMEIREKYKNDKQKMNQEIMGLYKTYKVNPASGCLPLLVQMPIFFALYRMLYQAIELRHAPFVGWITDLSAPDRLFHFNFSIPMMQEPYGIPMLTLLMGASFLLQQKMTPTAGDPMQAKMMMLMPIFMTVIFINFPAGLVLYMFVNNIISMGQQYYIQKKLS